MPRNKASNRIANNAAGMAPRIINSVLFRSIPSKIISPKPPAPIKAASVAVPIVVFVVVALVEGVGAIADNVGADAHVLAVVFAGPGFGGLQQRPAGALAADFLVDDQSVDFGAGRDFDERHGADVDPADYASGFFFGDETGGSFLAEYEFQANGHFTRGYRVAELRGKLRDARRVRSSRSANGHREFCRRHWPSTFLTAQAKLHCFAAQFTECVSGNPFCCA